ncbi:hypothetical protein QWT87_10985 [Chryseobacterium sp. APV1]|uniref:Uncharacterized protein n=1 Tax=Chryseobacterium urinae TaxID=3058400 RepID=A0ABT8U2Y3_9FLAO|nr:hypothetical protein [Chryseobacterium sp. APV1]MDO3425416.1 hypothetical protein [Chryseobacterium sp. APV1]
MITKEQEHQIELYLNSKKLTAQILAEVKDHFISQISHLMLSENLSFSEAFLKTKISWKNELEMVNADFLSFKKVARIEKVILQQRFRKIGIFSFILATAAIFIMFLNTDVFFTVQIVLLGSLTILLAYSFIAKKMKFSNYIAMSFHPLLLRNLFFGVLIFAFGSFITVENWKIMDMNVSKFLSVYSLAVQLQLLYFNSKKINVLV